MFILLPILPFVSAWKNSVPVLTGGTILCNMTPNWGYNILSSNNTTKRSSKVVRFIIHTKPTLKNLGSKVHWNDLSWFKYAFQVSSELKLQLFFIVKSKLTLIHRFTLEWLYKLKNFITIYHLLCRNFFLHLYNGANWYSEPC